jgi:hypothetical protein
MVYRQINPIGDNRGIFDGLRADDIQRHIGNGAQKNSPKKPVQLVGEPRLPEKLNSNEDEKKQSAQLILYDKMHSGLQSGKV